MTIQMRNSWAVEVRLKYDPPKWYIIRAVVSQIRVVGLICKSIDKGVMNGHNSFERGVRACPPRKLSVRSSETTSGAI